MDYFLNPVSSISNAVEINKLKDKRKKFNDEINEYVKSLNRHEEHTELKNLINVSIESNNAVLKNLRTLFVKSNKKFDVEFNEFVKTTSDADLIMYKTLYDNLMETNKKLTEHAEHLNKNISIDKEIYLERIKSSEKKIEEINGKLNAVREKQFG